MIGKILAISDIHGKNTIEQSEPEWIKHGFEVVYSSFQSIIKINNLEHYFLLTLTMGHENSILFHEYAMFIRNISPIPIVYFVYDKFEADEEINLLNTGADQVIELPIDMELAVEKCITLIKRYAKTINESKLPMTIYVAENLYFCVEKYSVIVDNKEIELLEKECHILQMLMANRGQVITYDQLIEKVWGCEYLDNSKSIVWNQIKNLRKKLQWHKGLPEYIITERNIGYRFNPRYLEK